MKNLQYLRIYDSEINSTDIAGEKKVKIDNAVDNSMKSVADSIAMGELIVPKKIPVVIVKDNDFGEHEYVKGFWVFPHECTNIKDATFRCTPFTPPEAVKVSKFCGIEYTGPKRGLDYMEHQAKVCKNILTTAGICGLTAIAGIIIKKNKSKESE